MSLLKWASRGWRGRSKWSKHLFQLQIFLRRMLLKKKKLLNFYLVVGWNPQSRILNWSWTCLETPFLGIYLCKAYASRVKRSRSPFLFTEVSRTRYLAPPCLKLKEDEGFLFNIKNSQLTVANHIQKKNFRGVGTMNQSKLSNKSSHTALLKTMLSENSVDRGEAPAKDRAFGVCRY